MVVIYKRAFDKKRFDTKKYLLGAYTKMGPHQLTTQPFHRRLIETWGRHSNNGSRRIIDNMIKTQEIDQIGIDMNTSTSGNDSNDPDVKGDAFKKKEAALKGWLENMGLAFNPFSFPDAGADPKISEYLVFHDQFTAISGLSPAFIFAPAGGGKTSFRVRLSFACRSGEGNRSIFPVTFIIPQPEKRGETEEQREERRWSELAKAFAHELMVYLIYHPLVISKLDTSHTIQLRQNLEWNLPISLNYYLKRLDFDKTGWVVQDNDPTLHSLLNPPSAEDLKRLREKYNSIQLPKQASPPARERFEQIKRFVLQNMGFDGIFLLADGADAYAETSKSPHQSYCNIEWLLDQTFEWMSERIYVKYFLPIELREEIDRNKPALLTQPVKITIIEWKPDDLVQIIRERLQVASGGAFDSLDAISSVPLRGVESKIVKEANTSPREVVELTDRLFREHAQNDAVDEKLTPRDLKAAIGWYKDRIG